MRILSLGSYEDDISSTLESIQSKYLTLLNPIQGNDSFIHNAFILFSSSSIKFSFLILCPLDFAKWRTSPPAPLSGLQRLLDEDISFDIKKWNLRFDYILQG